MLRIQRHSSQFLQIIMPSGNIFLSNPRPGEDSTDHMRRVRAFVEEVNELLHPAEKAAPVREPAPAREEAPAKRTKKVSRSK